MKITFKNKKAIIVGASKGIGKKIFEDIKNLGGNVIGISSKDFDFSNRNELIKFQNYLKKFKNIDILINCAGKIQKNHIFKNNIEDIEKILKINFFSYYISSSQVGKLMKRGGKIVNISSLAGTLVQKNRSIYSISKHAVNGLTKALVADLAYKKIIVNSVSPGPTKTQMVRKNLSKRNINKICKLIPLARLASTKEISSLVIFLVSDYNNYINGQNIFIDGGLTSFINFD